MKIYVAGTMRGYPAFNFPAFRVATNKLREEGHEVFSPVEKDEDIHEEGAFDVFETGDEEEATKVIGFSLRKALGDDTAWICREAEAIYMLKGWEGSKGAIAGKALGEALRLEIMYE